MSIFIWASMGDATAKSSLKHALAIPKQQNPILCIWYECELNRVQQYSLRKWQKMKIKFKAKK